MLDDTVNAYADSEKYVIGLHTGLMRSVGSEDELVWVMAHEAGHLLFGHAHKIRNALGYQLIGAAVGWGIGVALESSSAVEVLGELGMETGAQLGYLAYSPEIKLDAGQFAAYVMREAGYGPEASLSMIVRLHRGDVPAHVRRGDGWPGYLDTHLANNCRLIAMASLLEDIRYPGGQNATPEGSVPPPLGPIHAKRTAQPDSAAVGPIATTTAVARMESRSCGSAGLTLRYPHEFRYESAAANAATATSATFSLIPSPIHSASILTPLPHMTSTPFSR